MLDSVTVVGAGLAGSEAAWQLAQMGIRVKLYEMRPEATTPAHNTGDFAELVCSNSFRAAALENAVGLLKEEMRNMNSLIMACADRNKVPAGGALAVDRDFFSREVTSILENHPLIEVIRQEVKSIPDQGISILATGPLTSKAMETAISGLTGQEYLYFYDAMAPIVVKESINMERAFFSSRYDKGDGDYINCPMEKDEYIRFREELSNAERAPKREFEKEINFEGCMPIEVMASRGEDTMRYGPLKPVGLVDPSTGRRPYAVVQLRQDNGAGTLYNLVGFQTHLKWGEQQRVFGMIPGLENAEFVRFGVMHRNTYINSPELLSNTYQFKNRPNLFVAGQITGVEGYLESASSGLVAGINAGRLKQGIEPLVFPVETANGALANYITSTGSKNFQPMNITFGLLPPLDEAIRDRRDRNAAISNRALEALNRFKEINRLVV
ncbi:MAG: FADH(2)-oxidizing methylenetetrahydrofolate--tRNA-(uracil(54)-C(5))-methyltransferase TrmFO [Peptococcaceae bacterium]|nr:FADH(2)-oxidizing methylenetetrahydrofolate--tRNA-(uracil(54)-C(5))-methyltransferase TrmFO [Peptococcaceae bacterium]